MLGLWHGGIPRLITIIHSVSTMRPAIAYWITTVSIFCIYCKHECFVEAWWLFFVVAGLWGLFPWCVQHSLHGCTGPCVTGLLQCCVWAFWNMHCLCCKNVHQGRSIFLPFLMLVTSLSSAVAHLIQVRTWSCCYLFTHIPFLLSCFNCLEKVKWCICLP